MVKYAICFLLIVVIFCQAQKLLAQPGLAYRSISPKTVEASKIPEVVGHYTDSLLILYDSTQYSGGYVLMSKPHFDMFINKYFSYLSTSTVGLPNGNSISLQPTTNSTRLEGNISRKCTYSIYNFGVKADFSNNIANLFSAKDVTGNTTFYTNVSFLNTGKSVIEYNANTARSYNDRKIFAVQNYNSGVLIKYGVNYTNDSLAYFTIKHRLDSIIAIQKVSASDTNTYKIILTRDSMYTAMTKLAAYGLNERKAYYSVEGHMDDITKQLTDSLRALVDTMEVNNPAWISFKFSWFSAGLTYTRPQYKTYDQTKDFASRVGDLTFNNAGLTLGYNSIFQRNDTYLNVMKKHFLKAVYFNAAYTLANDLNFSHIDPLDFQTIIRADSSNTSYQFQETAKVLDISGKNKQVDWMHSLGLQTTWVLARGNFMGINTGITGTYSKFAKPNYSGKLGFLFRFMNSADQKSIINFELFLSLPDWEDSKDKGTSTWQRKSVGINATVPFNKLFF